MAGEHRVGFSSAGPQTGMLQFALSPPLFSRLSLSLPRPPSELRLDLSKIDQDLGEIYGVGKLYGHEDCLTELSTQMGVHIRYAAAYWRTRVPCSTLVPY